MDQRQLDAMADRMADLADQIRAGAAGDVSITITHGDTATLTESTPCNPSIEDGLTYAADIGLNPPSAPGAFPTTFYATCGCGKRVLDSGTQDEAVAALATHRTQSPTPEEGDQ